jgi:hypothetical protein
MGAGISPMGMNMPQQPQGLGKGGGGTPENRAIFSQMAASAAATPRYQTMNPFGVMEAQPTAPLGAMQNEAQLVQAQQPMPQPVPQLMPQPMNQIGDMSFVQPAQPAPLQVPTMQVDQTQAPVAQTPLDQMNAMRQRPQAVFGPSQFPMGNPMFGGLGALRAMPSSGGFFSRGKGGGGFSQAQRPQSLFGPAARGLGGFFGRTMR